MEKPSKDDIIDFLLNTLNEDKFTNIDSKRIREKFNLSLSFEDIELVNNSVKKAEYRLLIDLNQNGTFAKLTEAGVSVKDVGWLNFIGFEKTKIKENIEIESIKKETLKIDLKLKKWQLKTFWWLFAIAIIGCFFSIYNFKKDLSSSEDLIELQKKVKEIELEQTKLRILPSSQKNIDSLHNPNSYKIK